MRCSAIQGLTAKQAKTSQANFLADGASVELLDEGGGLFTLVFCFPDAPDPVDSPPDRLPPKAAGVPGKLDAEPSPSFVAAALNNPELGALSSRFESNGRPGAIGCDKNGGFSYGQYQIACRPGTMSTFLGFLAQRFPALSAPLQAAGGVAAATQGSEVFKAAWRKLAADPAFGVSQHAFIAETHYQPFAQHLFESLGLDLEQRSAALRDVAWSVAVQHGPGNAVFDRALSPLGQPLPADDAVLINAVYDERSQINKYFSKSTAVVQAAVADRFRHERQLALNQMLLPDTRLA
jgi:hypothetical protein